MNDGANPLYRALDDAGGRRDGDFVRALAVRVDARELLFDPDVDYGIRDAPEGEEWVNINWAFAVPRVWLMDWLDQMGTAGGPPQRTREERRSRHHRPSGPS